MTRHCLALLAATAVATAATPAIAQQVPPAPPASHPPGWVDPQAPHYPMQVGAPFATQGAVYASGPVVYPPTPTVAGAVQTVPAAPGAAAAYGYGYQYGSAAAPCGCPAYSYTWVQAPVHTNYTYSPAIAHERQYYTTETVNETVSVPVRATKYVKTARPNKYTKGKTVRTK